MGDIAEYYRDNEEWVSEQMNLTPQDEEIHNFRNKMWKQKTGELIHIIDMTPLHKTNTITAIKEGRIKLQFPQGWIKKLKQK